MKVSILGVGALVCLGIAVVQAGLFTKSGSNSQLHMLQRAKRSFMKRGHAGEDDSCKLQCEDYGLIAYVYGVVANQLIHCYTDDLYQQHYSSLESSEDSSSDSGDDDEEEDGMAFFYYACDFLQETAQDELEAHKNPSYKPKIYTCSEYEYFLLAASCLSTYMNLAEYYYAQLYTNITGQDELVFGLETSLLHECNDLFFGPNCLVMYLIDYHDKENCAYYDLYGDFGQYYSNIEDWFCPSTTATVNVKKGVANPKKKVTKANVEQLKAANVARMNTKKEQAKNNARSKEFENLSELKRLLQGILQSNKN